jgi:two-component system, chemotaxis family, protein-glutamate methylesterase/glutaminase
MYAIPPRVDAGPEPQLAGVSCPDCCGSLSVEPEGKRGDLVFECRVGHTYSVEELLVAKEERLHARLWTAYTALTELAALLDDLAARAATDDSRRRYAERSEVARAQAAGLRRLIEDNRPVTLPAEGEPS